MSDAGLYIAGSGLAAQQLGMNTVAENLSNANTAGYIQEQPNLVALPGGGPDTAGSGVGVAGIAQLTNSVEQANYLAAKGQNGAAQALSTTMQAIQDYFPDPSTNGFQAQLSTFWNQWDTIAQNPSAEAPYTVEVGQARTVVSMLNQMANGLQQTAASTLSQLSDAVTQANTQLADVARLNEQVTAGSAAGQNVTSLIDQRNALIQQLGASMGVTAVPQANGSVNLSIGGTMVVQGTTSQTLDATSTGGVTSIGIPGVGVTLDVTGGEAAGWLSALNQQIPTLSSQLNTVAQNLATTVNNQLAAGYTSTGASGSSYPMFTSSTGGTVTASSIEVNPALVSNPMYLAASSSATAGNDGGNAQAMANLYNSPTGPDQAYQTLIGNLGVAVQSAQDTAENTRSVETAAGGLEQSTSGVDTSQQEVNLLAYQQAYQASAKVISVMNAAINSLLAAT